MTRKITDAPVPIFDVTFVMKSGAVVTLPFTKFELERGTWSWTSAPGGPALLHFDPDELAVMHYSARVSA